MHMSAHQGVCHFRLLWDEELIELRPVLEAIARRREDVLRGWHELYEAHFGSERALPEAEFRRIYGADLEATTADLLARDMNRFAADVRAVGEELAAREVPFAEVVASMHFFEESAHAVFPEKPEPRVYLAFDKLSHCRMIVLADAYFLSRHAGATARIRGLEREAGGLPPERRRSFHGMIGASEPMRRLYERVRAAAAARGTILVTGESGSGKELVARAIHECGPAPGLPFVALNCAAIPRELIESELFGYRRGAFSGATTEYLGLFRAAEGGTLFLDEITEMAPETQTKLLRALQERKVRPVGSTGEVPVDVRLIASTNQDPEDAVAQGRLRPDLYYRLQVNVLQVPPLRERLADLPLLVEHFIALFNEKLRRPQPVTGLEPDALETMMNYDWPGNVRELANAIESAFTFGTAPTLRLADLPEPISRRRPRPPEATGRGSVETYAEAERDLVQRALESTGHNKVRAAKLLGVSRKKLYAKIHKYALE